MIRVPFDFYLNQQPFPFRIKEAHLLFMAMVQAKRKAHGEPDSIVWGIIPDGHWLYFSRLNNEGGWSIVAYRVGQMARGTLSI